MKKLLAAIVIVVALGAFYMFYQISSTPPTLSAITPSGTGTGNNGTTPTPSSTGSTPPPTTTSVPTTPAPKPVTSGYKDGSYTGSVTDAFYGKVQVKATITNGTITDVAFLEYPSDNGHSLEVNQRAMPLLTQEALQAQSANVDIVSGATQTSQAFQESLGNALAQAKA